ncbi:anti-sigma factor domain-containing protein [Natranaerofaba carboxydovora]|uniref:anti-sigma-I factor RsgI family protein n=1 Tax=Natranaerofaba carboxydovora TaxID=2742683 RepID=UPI001F13AF47|nr:anti-sigma factor domain-containing protein [Natranaerofaba carboxydovora]
MNKNKIKAVVMRIEGDYVKVATEDRRFLTLSLPNEGTEVGEEIWIDPAEVDNKKKTSLLGHTRAISAAAVILIMIVGIVYSTVAPTSPTGEAAAYLAIDINPSIELAIDSENQVVDIISYDTEAEELTRDISLDELDNKNTFTVLKALVNKAKDKGYIHPGDENLFLITLVGANNDSENIDSVALAELTSRIVKEELTSHLQDLEIFGRVGVQQATLDDRVEAKGQERSINNYVLQKKASKEVGASKEELRNLENRELIDEIAKRDLPARRVFDEFDESKGPEGEGPPEVPPGQREKPPGLRDEPPGLRDDHPGRGEKPPGQRDEHPGERPDDDRDSSGREFEPGQEEPPGQKDAPGLEEDPWEVDPSEKNQEHVPPGQKEVPPGREDERPEKDDEISEQDDDELLEKEDGDTREKDHPRDKVPGQEKPPGLDEDLQEEDSPEKGQEDIPPGQKEVPPGKEDETSKKGH